MSISRKRPPVGVIMYFAGVLTLCLYFAFAAIQGDYGLFRRVQIDAEADILRQDLAVLTKDVA